METPHDAAKPRAARVGWPFASNALATARLLPERWRRDGLGFAQIHRDAADQVRGRVDVEHDGLVRAPPSGVGVDRLVELGDDRRRRDDEPIDVQGVPGEPRDRLAQEGDVRRTAAVHVAVGSDPLDVGVHGSGQTLPVAARQGGQEALDGDGTHRGAQR